MSKEEIKIPDSNEISFREKIEKRIEFIHKHAGGITLISKEIEKEGVEYSIRQVVQKKGHR